MKAMTSTPFLWAGLMAFFVLLAEAGAQRREPEGPRAADRAATAQAGEAIDFERARSYMRKKRDGEKLTADEEAYLNRAVAARQGKGKAQGTGGRDKIGLTPLSEMSRDDRYQGEDGGLYGEGKNAPPDEHQKSAEAELAKIRPLDRTGKPAKDGAIGFISISMSNATQEFSYFKRLADADPKKSPQVKIVDCAQGGQAMAEWVDPQAKAWLEADRRLAAAAVTPEQVQVAWIKLANKSPSGDLQKHGKKLQQDTTKVIQNAKARFPNLRVVYLGSRIYGGYSGGSLNPEPYAYESAFVVRWLIRDQIKGDAALNFDVAKGPVKAPLLLWGPYFWADGVTPRNSDNLVWKREDLLGDGTHPSQSGREKVAAMLLKFMKDDPLARTWFTQRVD